MTDVTIEGATKFGKYVFDADVKIKNLTINGDATLGGGCFRSCTGLSKININANIANADGYSADGRWDRDKDNSVFWEAGKNSGDLVVTFGESVENVPNYLFATGHEMEDKFYAYVREVVFPDSLKKIGSYAFYRCHDLKKVTFGKELQTINSNAFAYCTSLDEIVISGSDKGYVAPESVTEIAQYAFYATALNSIKTSKYLKTVGEGAFSSCPSVTSVEIGGSTNFGGAAFAYNSKLASIIINGNSSFAAGGFRECTALNSITIAGNIGNCGSYSADGRWDRDKDNAVFWDTGRNQTSFKVVFMPGVTVIPDYLFATGREKAENVYCRITSVEIPVSVKSIGKYAFYNCYDLKSVSYGGTEARFKSLLVNDKGESNGNDILLGSDVTKTYEGKKYNAKDWADPTDDPSEEPTKPENPENPETPGAGDGETIAINESNNLVIKQKVDITKYLPTEKFSVSVSPKGVGAVSKKKVDGVTRYFFTAKKVCDVPIEITAYKKVGGKKETIKKITLQEKIVKPVVNKSFVKLKTGDTISANEIFSENTPKITSWSSSNPLIADVDQTTGTISITANEKAGSAKIYAYIGNVKYTISVKAKTPMLSKVSMKVGGMKKIKIKNLTSAPSAYRSENDKVATVSSDGYVTGLSIGTTRVWATIDGVEYPCFVTIKP